MPEIPEVEAFKSYIKKTSLNKKIVDVTEQGKSLIQKSSFASFKKTLVDQKFISVERSGKYLILKLSNSDKKLVMHFGLTGTLDYQKNADTKIKYSKVTFIFNGNSALHWINKQLFGKLWLVQDINSIKGIKELGPDPLKLSEKKFIELANQHSDKNVKTFLMDQKIIAGIGNEYSDEILFQAGIDPHHTLDDLSTAQIKKLYSKTKSVLKYFITFRKKYMNAMAGHQYFTNEDTSAAKIKNSYLQAHRHGDGKCPKNKNHMLKKVTIGGRSAYYCPIDQK